MKNLKILFISTWGINDGLSASTTFPHLKLLESFDSVESVYYVTIERGSYSNPFAKNPKVIHQPFYSGNSLVNKIMEYAQLFRHCYKIAEEYNINRIIARGAPAGIYACRLHLNLNIPFDVESFEPHADYMAESGTWSRVNPKYLIQKYWEQKQLKHATTLTTVSSNYKSKLLSFNSNLNIKVNHCTSDETLFSFNKRKRALIRQKYSIGNKLTGIYIGKFGGIYHDEYAFKVMKKFLKQTNTFLIILTPQLEHSTIELKKLNLINSYLVANVPHQEVNAYLSASDFAFSFVKSTPYSLFCSPIKNGEYFLNGLPILTTKNIGDDHNYISQNNLGVFLDEKTPKFDFEKLNEILNSNSERINNNIRTYALKHKSSIIDVKLYKKLYSCPQS